VELDGQGRVRIPPELAALADLDKEITLVGVRDHLELWNRERWQVYLAQRRENYDELAEKAFTPPTEKD
jgi:MraZ protein